jgi:DNA-directed RNA polymerase specialized sigma24 family protein
MINMNHQDSKIDIHDFLTLQSLMEKLSPKEREIIYLWLWKDLSFEVIGEIVGPKYSGRVLKDSTMRYHMKKILEKLRSWVDNPSEMPS